MTVQVTAEDIQHGKRTDCFGCPIYRAIRQILIVNYSLFVCSSYIMITTDIGQQVVMDLPHSAREFIKKFDTWIDVSSFEFPMPGLEWYTHEFHRVHSSPATHG